MIDYFEDLLRKPTLFKDESKLDVHYLPKYLPHREKELSILSQLFLTTLTRPNKVSRKLLITGKTGIGKSATLKIFGDMLQKAAIKRNINVKYVHINCRKERTSYKVLIKLIRSFNNNFPKKGYSLQDILDIIIDYLNSTNTHLLLVLDELSYLINKNDDLIYSLTRINDDSINSPHFISIIGIVRNISCINNLDDSTLSTLQTNIINFTKYSNKQIYDIIKFRVKISLKENVISDDLIKMLSRLIEEEGDIRYGLNLIWRAGKAAERKNIDHITSECIRISNQDIIPYTTQEVLLYLEKEQLIFLLSIIRTLKISQKVRVSISEIYDTYSMVCENLKVEKRSYSQIWKYLREFKKENLITIYSRSKNIRGRKSYVEIRNISLKKYEELVNEFLNEK